MIHYADSSFLVSCYVTGRKHATGKGVFAPTGAFEAFDREKDDARKARMARSLGLIDTHSHAHRMAYPVLLTAGERDLSCPVDSIQALYDRLPSARSITVLAGVEHGYTFGFLRLAHAWFDLYL